MYNDFDCNDEYDFEYEEFRSTTGHITNFSPEYEANYITAIEEYTKVHPEVKICVAAGYKWPNTKGLYVDGDYTDLSDFWEIYALIAVCNITSE